MDHLGVFASMHRYPPARDADRLPPQLPSSVRTIGSVNSPLSAWLKAAGSRFADGVAAFSHTAPALRLRFAFLIDRIEIRFGCSKCVQTFFALLTQQVSERGQMTSFHRVTSQQLASKRGKRYATQSGQSGGAEALNTV
jgi:hypothetical protein